MLNIFHYKRYDILIGIVQIKPLHVWETGLKYYLLVETRPECDPDECVRESSGAGRLSEHWLLSQGSAKHNLTLTSMMATLNTAC